MTIQEFAAWVDGCLETAQSTQAAREAIKRKSESLRLNMSIGWPIQIGANPPGAIGGGGGIGSAQEIHDKCSMLYAGGSLKESAM